MIIFLKNNLTRHLFFIPFPGTNTNANLKRRKTCNCHQDVSVATRTLRKQTAMFVTFKTSFFSSAWNLKKKSFSRRFPWKHDTHPPNPSCSNSSVILTIWITSKTPLSLIPFNEALFVNFLMPISSSQQTLNTSLHFLHHATPRAFFFFFFFFLLLSFIYAWKFGRQISRQVGGGIQGFAVHSYRLHHPYFTRKCSGKKSGWRKQLNTAQSGEKNFCAPLKTIDSLASSTWCRKLDVRVNGFGTCNPVFARAPDRVGTREGGGELCTNEQTARVFLWSVCAS